MEGRALAKVADKAMDKFEAGGEKAVRWKKRKGG